MFNIVELVQQELRRAQGECPGMSAGETYDLNFIAGITIDTQVLIPDVSFYQKNINFVTMKNAGAMGAVIRAGQRTWIDVRFVENWRKAKEADLPRATYWFYDSRETPEKQAALWWSLVKNDPADLFYAPDFEENYGGPYGKAEHFQRFVQEFQKLSGVPDKKIVIYTGYHWWNSRVGNVLFFKRYKLWLAWYSSMSVVRTPAPWAESDLLMWQFTSHGDGPKYGVESLNIDLNWFCCSVQEYNAYFNLGTTPINEYQKVVRFNSNAHVLVIDPQSNKVHVTNTNGQLETVSSAAKRLGAKYAINGDGWNIDPPYLPLSIAASNGNIYQPNQFNSRPFLNISKSRTPSIGWNDLSNLYNAVSGARYILINSVKPPYLSYNEPQYTERHPRTGAGITADGKIILVVVDGRSSTSLGVTLFDLANILLEFGARDAIDLDGGGSSAMWAGDRIVNVPSDGSERFVVNHVIIGGSMQIIKGNVLAQVYIREGHSSEFPIMGGLYNGDKVEASENYFQWLHLTKIIRANGNVETPGSNWWASAGSMEQYISWDWFTVDEPAPPPPPPPSSDEYILHVKDGVTRKFVLQQ